MFNNCLKSYNFAAHSLDISIPNLIKLKKEAKRYFKSAQKLTKEDDSATFLKITIS